MNKTGIEYLTHTWNPIAMRCTPASDGCKHCWAMAMSRRHAGNKALRPEVREARAGGAPWLDERELQAPLRMKKPAVIGVQFMGDLFHERVGVVQIERVLGVMREATWHQFVLLTKRPWRLADLQVMGGGNFSLSENIAFGASISNQDDADRWIPHVLRVQAHCRIVSVEPMLGAVDLGNIADKSGWRNVLYGFSQYVSSGEPRIDGVICGGESGPGARPMHPDWARSLRDQCKAAGVKFYFKQWGAYFPDRTCWGQWQWLHKHGCWCLKSPSGKVWCSVFDNGTWYVWDENGTGGENDVAANVAEAKQQAEDALMRAVFTHGWHLGALRMGAKMAPLLDGREHLELPWEHRT